jgi:hypothetical protein
MTTRVSHVQAVALGVALSLGLVAWLTTMASAPRYSSEDMGDLGAYCVVLLGAAVVLGALGKASRRRWRSTRDAGPAPVAVDGATRRRGRLVAADRADPVRFRRRAGSCRGRRRIGPPPRPGEEEGARSCTWSCRAHRAAGLDSVWRPEAARHGLGALPGPTVEVFCDCPPAVARDRYARRAGQRHAGHFDRDRVVGDDLWAPGAAGPVAGLWPVVRVDTTRPVDMARLAAEVRSSRPRSR